MNVPGSLDLEEGEKALGSWTCGVPGSPDSAVVKHEGTLVLTDRRVVYEPMRALPGARALLGGSRQSFRLSEIERAEAIEAKVPRLRLTIDDREPVTVILSGSRFSLPWSKKKWLALDEAVSAISHETDGGRVT
jgi:hypothetical protein